MHTVNNQHLACPHCSTMHTVNNTLPVPPLPVPTAAQCTQSTTPCLSPLQHNAHSQSPLQRNAHSQQHLACPLIACPHCSAMHTVNNTLPVSTAAQCTQSVPTAAQCTQSIINTLPVPPLPVPTAAQCTQSIINTLLVLPLSV